VLILSAPIGDGHDKPAYLLAEALRARRPDAAVAVADGLHAMGPFLERVIMGGSRFDSRWGNLLFDLEYFGFTHVAPARAGSARFMEIVGGRGLLRLLAAARPDIVVSTYPGVTEVLGRLRAHHRLGIPVVAAITDLAALRYWAHPGADLHLIIHPESVEEVRRIAGPRTSVVAVRGLSDPRFLAAPPAEEARAQLGLPPDGAVVVVSGGGWGVGDLAGAVDLVLARRGASAVAVCGRNDELRARLTARYAPEPRVRVLGFTDDLPVLFAAADVLIHSTAGLTVLEALACGCRVISYGWGRGHIRANNRAYARFGLADVARDRVQLDRALSRALAEPRPPDTSLRALPEAADVVLAQLARAS
jgi:UDP-N-acetylglucosamine:LPS N-acetylglucosamine transferase